MTAYAAIILTAAVLALLHLTGRLLAALYDDRHDGG